MDDFTLHNFDALSEIERKRIRKKRRKMLADHIYGTRVNDKIDAWLGIDHGWLVDIVWSCDPETMRALQREFSTGGVVDWGDLDDHLASGEVEGAYQIYQDPGDPSDVVLVTHTVEIPFEVKKLKSTFNLVEGGKETSE